MAEVWESKADSLPKPLLHYEKNPETQGAAKTTNNERNTVCIWPDQEQAIGPRDVYEEDARGLNDLFHHSPALRLIATLQDAFTN